MKHAQATGLVIAILIAAAAAGFGAYEWMQPLPKPSPMTLAQPGVELAPAMTADQAMNTHMDDLQGQPHTLADWHGKVLMVNFWATWCPPCRQEIPLLVKLQAQYAGQGLQIIGIATDERNVQTVRKFMKPMLINYPILMGTDQVPQIIAALGGTYVGLPYTILLNRQGQVYKIHQGELDPKQADALVQQAIAASIPKSTAKMMGTQGN
ncbi:MAG: TlpA family protein disulfide reductase [Gammaproteobacteria bacterium]|nr:TlpA family protein disulfide reductase [Gammaproteobacteria bacterium]MDE2346414.1 TlpA family protein disulfide reductase [Gammaproteobacteria bacterium]